jgi:tetratricopeptide (TPR) repeat protein
MLETPRFRRLDGMTSAERRHARDVAQYVLVGGKMDGRTALYTGTQLAAQGAQAAQSLGIFNVIGMLTRAWGAWRRDPASNQKIIDEGEQFLATDPDPKDASEAHARLSEAYERAGVYDRALMHYRAVSSPELKRISALEEKVAEKLLENAKKDGGEPALLNAIVRHYPTTEAAEEARKALDAMPKAGEIKLSREVLLAHPSLLGPTALDIGPTLLDGKDANGELADAGVTLGPAVGSRSR